MEVQLIARRREKFKKSKWGKVKELREVSWGGKGKKLGIEVMIRHREQTALESRGSSEVLMIVNQLMQCRESRTQG